MYAVETSQIFVRSCPLASRQNMASTKGHVTRVTGGDWHPNKRNEMLTCSVDGSVRLWNLNGKKSFDNLINQSVSYDALLRLS